MPTHSNAHSFFLSPEKFKEGAKRLKDKNNISIDTSHFGEGEWRVLSAFGISAVYQYDRANKILHVEVINKPIFLTTEKIYSQIQEWFL